MHFEQIDIDTVDWQSMNAFGDRTVHQTEPWLRFLAKTQDCKPIVAALKDGSETVGYFTGCLFKKFGFRFLGSPFPGWTTSYMGFNLVPQVQRKEALLALSRFAFRDLRCVHIELMDRLLESDSAQRTGFTVSNMKGFEIDLTRTEEDIFNSMESSCRRCVRKAEKTGVRIEEASDLAFADDYYEQLQDVFAKQKLAPTYTVGRVRALIEHLHPAGMLLLLRAIAPDGRCIGTGIFPGFNDFAYFWGGASWRPDQILRPNEALQWYAIRYWKSKGMRRYDLGGGGSYKEKYGGCKIVVPWLRKSKYTFVEPARGVYKSLWKRSRQIAGSVK